MATSNDLMGVGMTAEHARRCGFFIQSITAATTIQGPGNAILLVATAASVILGDSFVPGDMVFIANKAVTVSLFGGTTGAIYPTSAGVARSVTSNVSRFLIKTEANVWHVVATA